MSGKAEEIGNLGGPNTSPEPMEMSIPQLNSMRKPVGGAVASWLVRSSPDRAVRVRALAGDIMLCSWARHFTLTVPLSTQVGTGELNAGGNPAMD